MEFPPDLFFKDGAPSGKDEEAEARPKTRREVYREIIAHSKEARARVSPQHSANYGSSCFAGWELNACLRLVSFLRPSLRFSGTVQEVLHREASLSPCRILDVLYVPSVSALETFFVSTRVQNRAGDAHLQAGRRRRRRGVL